MELNDSFYSSEGHSMDDIHAEFEAKGFTNIYHFFVKYDFEVTASLKEGFAALKNYFKDEMADRKFSISGYLVWNGEQQDHCSFYFDFKKHGDRIFLGPMSIDYRHPLQLDPFFNQHLVRPELKNLPNVEDARRTLKTFAAPIKKMSPAATRNRGRKF